MCFLSYEGLLLFGTHVPRYLLWGRLPPELCGKDPARCCCRASCTQNGGVQRCPGAAALVCREAGQVGGGESLFRSPQVLGTRPVVTGRGASLASAADTLGFAC